MACIFIGYRCWWRSTYSIATSKCGSIKVGLFWISSSVPLSTSAASVFFLDLKLSSRQDTAMLFNLIPVSCNVCSSTTPYSCTTVAAWIWCIVCTCTIIVSWVQAHTLIISNPHLGRYWIWMRSTMTDSGYLIVVIRWRHSAQGVAIQMESHAETLPCASLPDSCRRPYDHVDHLCCESSNSQEV